MFQMVNRNTIESEPESRMHFAFGSFFIGDDMKKKINTLDRYIIFCLAFLTLYTIVHTVIFAITGQEAVVLDGLAFATFGSEILFCFLIKRFKLHEEAKLIFGKKKEESDMGDE